MDNLISAVPTRIAQLAAVFSQPEPIRRGSLYERRMKCGQAACACQDDPQAAHGSYFTLTQKVKGKTRSRYIPPQQAPQVRQQIESGWQFRERVEAYWDACEQWADEQLEADSTSDQEAKKRAPNGPPPRGRPGNRNPLRSPVDRRLGSRSRGDGGAAPSFAAGSARPGATAQR